MSEVRITYDIADSGVKKFECTVMVTQEVTNIKKAPTKTQDKPETKGKWEGPCPNMRTIHHQYIRPDDIKDAIMEKRLHELLSTGDEIDIPVDKGGTVTAVCGYVEDDWARFVFKDCWDDGVMNNENTNKTGYFKSRGRAHVLTDILPHIAQEWRAIFKPRRMVEIIDGERVEYADLMWLPSATDVFGPSEDGYWKDEGDNLQHPIFEKERDRVKECGDNGTYPYWLRSVYASSTYTFRHVTASGGGSTNYAHYSYGFAPGFDIGEMEENNG